MKIIFDLTKSIQENASTYYSQGKEAKEKIKGVEKAIEETKEEIKTHKKSEGQKKKQIRVKKEKQWFEKFNWFTTSSGRLAVGGKDAKNNDLVYNKHLEDSDLFFHADIQGGSALVLKDGLTSSEKEKKECAQFSASFSKAWKNGNASVDVYSVKKSQVSKHSSGGFIPTGGFAIVGEREWFRSSQLGLKLGFNGDRLEIIPFCSERTLKSEVSIYPSNSGKEKGELAKTLSKRLSVHPDELLQILPSGKTKIK